MGIEVLRVVLAGQPDAIIGFRGAAGLKHIGCGCIFSVKHSRRSTSCLGCGGRAGL